MLLAIDIGNSTLKFGLFKAEALVCYGRLTTDVCQTSDLYGSLLRRTMVRNKLSPSLIKGAIVASVVPQMTRPIRKMLKEYFGLTPIMVSTRLSLGIRIRYDAPGPGADRIAGAVAAYQKFGGPVIIVGMGTATTFCAVSKAGDYLGGAISPGMHICVEALLAKTRKLPRVNLSLPKKVIGHNTKSGLQSGILYGYAGLVDTMVSRIQKEMGSVGTVVATGGMAPVVAPACKSLDCVLPTLTLEGLMLIYRMNGRL